MRRILTVLSPLFLLCALSFAQTANYPYVVKNFAGTWPLGDGGPAASAILYYPKAVAPDNAGNVYILDAYNYLVRKVAADGKISTIARLPIQTYDMKRGSDGSLYIAGKYQVLKVSTAGVVTVVAGNGDNGFAGDGGQATRAQVGITYGVAVDTAGNVYFSDVSSGSHRIREVTTDGKIQTIAGGAEGFGGDAGPATSALLDYPSGIAIDAAGTIYVADYNNGRIRKFKVGGVITTISGTGALGQPVNGPALGQKLGGVEGVAVDSAGTVYVTDTFWNVVFKIAANGALTVLAGNFDGYSHPEDGPALSVSLRDPWGVGVDAAGNVFITDDTHRIRQITTTGNLTTFAGRIHFSGDGGPATAAMLNEPTGVGIDAQGNALISDASNYLIRKVTTDGKINTFAGKSSPGAAVTGSSVFNTKLPYIVDAVMDRSGALYLAGYYQVYKISVDGTLTIIAGSGNFGNAGDGGKASLATFNEIDGIAVDGNGKVYIVDVGANRVRAVDPVTGNVSAFAGTGTHGFAGDGQLATSAVFNFAGFGRAAADADGNVYITDSGNLRVRKVDKQGIITTVVGNGSLGSADGVRATSAGFDFPMGVAVDAAGDLYISSFTDPVLYRVSGGILRRIVGTGSDIPADGVAAAGTAFFTYNLKVDANGDVYSVDIATSSVRKLIVNSPSGLTAADGDGQSAPVGQTLAKALKVQVMGRAGVGVAGATVNFAVTSGSGRVSAATTTTGADGTAGVTLTVGPNAGPVTVTATLDGSTLAPVTFKATGTSAPVTCSVAQPAIASVKSAGRLRRVGDVRVRVVAGDQGRESRRDHAAVGRGRFRRAECADGARRRDGHDQREEGVRGVHQSVADQRAGPGRCGDGIGGCDGGDVLVLVGDDAGAEGGGGGRTAGAGRVQPREAVCGRGAGGWVLRRTDGADSGSGVPSCEAGRRRDAIRHRLRRRDAGDSAGDRRVWAEQRSWADDLVRDDGGGGRIRGARAERGRAVPVQRDGPGRGGWGLRADGEGRGERDRADELSDGEAVRILAADERR
jgi:sugar lactone lactonase YvrE